MEPIVLAVVGIGLAGLFLWAIRNIAKGRRRFVWLVSAPALAGWIVVVWAASRVWGESPPLAVGLIVIAVPSFFLSVRRIRQQAAEPTAMRERGELSGAQFDYIIWMAIGLPFVLVAMLVVALITGGLSSPK